MYADERRLLEAPTAQPVAFLACGTLFVDDVADSLRDAGFRVYGVDLAGLAAEELAHTFERARPAVVVAINYTEGLAEFCADRGVPMICWEIDPSTSALPPCTRPVPEALVFTYRRAHVDEFRRAGFTRVEYLPLAANERRRAPQPVSAAERDAWSGNRPAFVGASLVTEIPRFELAFLGAHARLHGREDPLPDGRSLLDAVLVEQARDYGRYLVPAIIERFCPGLSTFLDGVAVRAAGEIAAARKRQAYVAALGALPSGVDVWGDAGWAELRTPGVRYRGPARHTADLNRIYSVCPVNVDIGRLYQNDIVTMRVFDVLACGGVLLAEWSPALEELFAVGRDVLAYHEAEDLVSHAARLLRTPEEGRALADAGRRAVLAHHTIARRVAHMLTRAPEIRR